MYVPTADSGSQPPYPGVLVCHGLTSDSTELRQAAATLSGRGLATMIFDFRGHGRSGGVCDRSQHLDVLDALRHLKRLPLVNGKRIGLVGHSSGARAALLAASEADVAAVVSLSLAPDDIAQRMAGADSALDLNKETLLGKTGAMARLLLSAVSGGPIRCLQLAALLVRLPHLRIDWTKTAAAWAEWKLTNALSVMKPRPMLFVHCKGDWATPAAASIEAYHACRGPKELWLEPGGFHTTPLRSATLRERWASWLCRQLYP